MRQRGQAKSLQTEIEYMKQIYWAVSAASLIGLALSTGSAAANHYPVVKQVKTAAVHRPCTQLELSAGIDKGQCGTLTVAEIVKKIRADEDND
jgi:hypothetical protein